MSSVPKNPIVGLAVNFVLPENSNFPGQVRPAIITKAWTTLDNELSPGMANLTVFRDQQGDFHPREAVMRDPAVQRTSVLYSLKRLPNTWHWPDDPASEPAADKEPDVVTIEAEAQTAA